jgi:protein ImuB
MPLGAAQAISGREQAVHFEQWDPSADAEGLRNAAAWCQRFSPQVAVEEPDSLLLDTTGSDHLFGGEQSLAEQVVAQLREHGYIAKVAVAGTPSAAWALAHYGARVVQVTAFDQLAEDLRPLPLEALRLSAEVIQTLRELDVRCIGQLMRLPRTALPSRFGQALLNHLDQLLGDIGDSLTPEEIVEPDEISWTFETPCEDRQILERVLEQLVARLLEKLCSRQLGVQRLVCHFSRTASDGCHLSVGLLQASTSLRHVMKLLRLNLERTEWSGEITDMTVQAIAAPLPSHQGHLFGGESWSERTRLFPTLVEVLSNRLGKRAVLRPILQADAQPECAWQYEPWLEQNLTVVARKCADLKPCQAFFRPSRLRDVPVPVSVLSLEPQGPPTRITWSRRNLVVARSWGPERIETGWWREADIRRDYFLVETTTAERFWLFRVIDQQQWFLHGIFA